MSNKRISDLAAAAALDGTELMELVQSGANVKSLLSALRTYLLAAFVFNETPAGTIDGTDGTDGNDEFTLADAPNPPGSLLLVKTDVGTGVVMIEGVHFDLVDDTITYTAGNIPVAGMTHRAWYKTA